VERPPALPRAGAGSPGGRPRSRLPGKLGRRLDRRGSQPGRRWIDGSLVERIVAKKDFEPTQRPVRFSIDGFEFDESFAASPEALQALAAFREEGGEPPWEHAAELRAEGLVNVHFDLTPRGRRALASFSQPTRS
jgi:hypothetical protein